MKKVALFLALIIIVSFLLVSINTSRNNINYYSRSFTVGKPDKLYETYTPYIAWFPITQTDTYIVIGGVGVYLVIYPYELDGFYLCELNITSNNVITPNIIKLPCYITYDDQGLLNGVLLVYSNSYIFTNFLKSNIGGYELPNDIWSFFVNTFDWYKNFVIFGWSFISNPLMPYYKWLNINDRSAEYAA